MAATKDDMEKLVALCKRRGFVFPASEIYGGINGFWDYGPLGIQLKNHIRDHWWRYMVECPPIGPDGHPLEIVGLDSSIIQNPRTWEASGHVAGFNDPMVDCRQCKARFRADHVFAVGWTNRDEFNAMLEKMPQAEALQRQFEEALVEADSPEAVMEANHLLQYELPESPRTYVKMVVATAKAEALEAAQLSNREKKRIGEAFPTVAALSEYPREWPAMRCPNCDAEDSLTEPRAFNLMFETYVGAIRDEDALAYLRPETAQGIFLNYKNILDTMRVKMPFGIAQVGKAFRNEVTPRNFIFRSREFEQMEMEWFCPPDEARQWYEFWKDQRMRWWRSLGIEEANLRFRDHDEDELAHYSQACVDVEYRYPFTWPDFGELEGIAHRGCFDLSQHQEHAGAKLEYFDQELQVKLQKEGLDKETIKQRSRYMPHVIEPASGLTRAVLVLLCEAFTPDADRPSKVYMKFHPQFAPIKAGIFPLVAKEGMPEVAEKLYLDLRKKFTCQFDVKQNIGKRYARMDEIGTPYCFTVDGDTLDDRTVTVRHRDTQHQERIPIDQVEQFLADRIGDVEP
jgi:glycyl-tRNA synthetase